MQTAEQLNAEFLIENCLHFDESHPGMPRALVHTPACTAELYLQGAHLTQWRPAAQEPVLFLSSRSAYVPGKAIRGGVPIIFPWFGAPETSPVHPPQGSASHGFARIWPWTLRFAGLAGDDLHLSLTLDHNERLHALGFDFLQLGVDITLGRTLTIRLSTALPGASMQPDPFLMEEALHAYLHVGSIEQVSIEGLAGTEFLDKTDNLLAKVQAEPELRFAGEIDRPYLDTSKSVILHDEVLRRDIVLTKTHSQTTVIWNPAAALTAKLPDLAPDDWRSFVCMETANAAKNAVHLRPGEAHTMTMQLAVQPTR